MTPRSPDAYRADMACAQRRARLHLERQRAGAPRHLGPPPPENPRPLTRGQFAVIVLATILPLLIWLALEPWGRLVVAELVVAVCAGAAIAMALRETEGW